MFRDYRHFAHKYPFLTNGTLAFVSVCFSVLFVEIGFRFFLSRYNPQAAAAIRQYSRMAARDDSPQRFQPHPYLSYVPSDVQYRNDGIQIRGQFFTFEKPADTIRIACLGGSTTMKKYPVDLQRELNRWPGATSFEVMDFGCDGWTLAETVINFFIRVSSFNPDIVILHHGANEGAPRQWPGFQPDYAHFRKSWEEPFIGLQTGKWLSNSWLVSYLLWRSGLSAFDLQNLTIRRVSKEAICEEPAPQSIEVVERNLRHLSTLVQAINAQLLVAPMPHLRQKEKPNVARMIEEFNDCARRLARDRGWPIAETDSLLQKHPEWFRDWVHVNRNGDFLKAQVYAMVVWDMLGRYSESDRGTAIRVFGDLSTAAPAGRDLELQWQFDSNQARYYEISVRKEDEKAFRLLGRTPTGNEKAFRWKRDSILPGYAVKPEFQGGPQFGHAYYFKVVALGKDEPPAVIAHMTSNDEVKVLERPVR